MHPEFPAPNATPGTRSTCKQTCRRLVARGPSWRLPGEQHLAGIEDPLGIHAAFDSGHEGLGSIIKGREQFRDRNGDLVITDPSRVVRSVIDNLGLTEVLKIFEDDAEADIVIPEVGVAAISSG